MPPERPSLPESRRGAHASPINWSEEIAVDARGNIYMNDDKWGLWILRYHRQGAEAPAATKTRRRNNAARPGLSSRRYQGRYRRVAR